MASGSSISLTGITLSWDGNFYSSTIKPVSAMSFRPTRVIFNGRNTVCFWPDGSKSVTTCAEGEPFIPEVGIAEAIVRKVYEGNRSEFLRLVENAYHQPTKSEMNEKRNQKEIRTTDNSDGI